jgi:hypothetical protein
MNHVRPILSIVFSTIFNAFKGEFYMNVTVVAGQNQRPPVEQGV